MFHLIYNSLMIFNDSMDGAYISEHCAHLVDEWQKSQKDLILLVVTMLMPIRGLHSATQMHLSLGNCKMYFYYPYIP